MRYLSCSVSWLALAASAIAVTCNVAYGADTTVTAGTTRTTSLTMTGADTLTVEETGIFATSGTAVTLNGVTTTLNIDNAGTISSTTGRAIRLNDNNNNKHSLTVTNEATGLIESAGDDAFQIGNALKGGTVTLDNYGTITSTASRAINFNSATGGTININNYSTGVISADVGADVMRPGQNATIKNYGTIQSAANADEFDGDGIDFQANTGGAVYNYDGGLIEGSKHGITGDNGATVYNAEGGTIRGRNGSGINFDTSSSTTTEVTNYGLISGEAQITSSDDTDGDGVDIDGLVTIENHGTIQALGARGFKDGVLSDPNISDGVSVGGGTVNNYAGATIHSVGRGILVDDSEGGSAFSATTIYNEGTISSDIDQAVTLTGTWNDTLTNKGTIIGDVRMGGGADIVSLYTGQSLTGQLDGGDDIDTLKLESINGEKADLQNVVNFEALDVEGGSWTLKDDQAYSSGATIYGAATLTADHVLDAVVTIQADGTVAGIGTLSGLVAEDGAIVSPGTQSIGTLSVDGDASLSSSVFHVDIDPDNTDRLVVTGTAAVNGGVVDLVPANGAYTIGSTYTIVSAGTAVTGTGFGSVSSPFLFIDPTLGTEANAITLTLDRNDVAFADLAKTGNQRQVANAIDGADPSSDLYRYIVGSSDQASLQSSYNQLDGEVHADVGGTLAEQGYQTQMALLSRLSQFGGVNAGGQTASAGSDSAALGYGDDPKSRTSSAFEAIKPVPSTYTAWTQAYGNRQSINGDGNAARADSSVGGALIGTDLSNDQFMIGLAGGYGWGSSTIDDRRSSADVETGLLALYGGSRFDKVILRAGGSFGWSTIDTKRTVTIGDLTEDPRASYDATTANVFAEAAYQAKFGASTVEPYAGLGWTHVALDGFRETNAPVTGLSSDGKSYDVPYATLGLRASTDMDVGGTKITPHGMIGWRHAFDDVSPDTTLAFNDTGTSFSVTGAPTARDSALLEAGADIMFNQNLKVGLTYSGSFASESTTNAIKAMGELKF